MNNYSCICIFSPNNAFLMTQVMSWHIMNPQAPHRAWHKSVPMAGVSKNLGQTELNELLLPDYSVLSGVFQIQPLPRG